MSSKAPSHEVHHVTGNDDKAYWTRVGAAWEHKDGEGFNIVLNYLPVGSDCRLVLRKFKLRADGE